MRRITHLCGALGLALAAMGFSSFGLADGALPPDTSADLVGGYNQVIHSRGVMVRVPINANGDENTSMAEARVDFSTSVPSTNDLPSRWNVAKPTSKALFNVNADTSTCWGWGCGWGGGWRGGYYYGGANFGFNYNNYYYGYGSSYYYNSWNAYSYGGYSYPGCRYYYYPSAWWY